MSLHAHRHEPLDPGRIHVLDPQELQYWCEEFGCTELELKEAVGRVGDHAARVREVFDAHHAAHDAPHRTAAHR